MTIKIEYKGQLVSIEYSEDNRMFVLEDNFDIVAYCSARTFEKAGFNQCWLLSEFLNEFEKANIVAPTANVKECAESEVGQMVLCDIIHPEFNDGGYSSFGNFARKHLGQQCQYASRYIDGRIEGYPSLGDGLRFNNGKRFGTIKELDTSDYHSVRIHRDDMDEFERRYKAYSSWNS